MRRAIAHHPAGHWPADQAGSAITLPWAERHRRRIMLSDDAGQGFLLDLPQAAILTEGDGLRLEDGGWIVVHAAAEAVAEATCGDGEQLARIAWHIGNRHIPLQVLPGGRLRILDDPVLVVMLAGLGARVEHRLAPFQSETGAYHHAGGDEHRHG
jgi:urease accessory protein